MGSGAGPVPEHDRQDRYTVNVKRVEGGTCPDDIRDRVIGPDLVEVDVSPVHFLLSRIDPAEDPAGHRKRRCRDKRSGLVQPLQHLVVDRRVHHHPGSQRAALAAVAHAHPDAQLGGQVEVGVGVDDVGGFPAEFHGVIAPTTPYGS